MWNLKGGSGSQPLASQRLQTCRDNPLIPRKPHAVLYVDHVTTGTDLFRVICERDMEGIVAKQAGASYTPDATTWVKIKNRQYSQAAGRHDFFENRRKA